MNDEAAPGPKWLSSSDVTDGLSDILQSVFGNLASPSQALAKASGTLERTARNHLSGANAMSLKDFLNACRNIPELQAWGADMMGINRPNLLLEAKIHQLLDAHHGGSDTVN